MHYLYKITNRLNGKVYIGQTVDDKKRWGAHKSFAKNPEKTGQYIHRAMAKYGVDNFVFEVISACRTQEDADATEDLLIKQYDSRNPDTGYNVLMGGNQGNWTGRKHTPESIAKISAAKTGTVASEETKQKQSQSMKEKVAEGWMPVNIFTSETAAVWQGKKLSEEHKQHISESNMGREVSEETRQKISQAQIGKVISEEQRQKMSEAMKGKRVSVKTEFKKGLVPWNKKALSQDQIDEIFKLSSERNGTRKISDLAGVNRRRISKILKEV